MTATITTSTILQTEYAKCVGRNKTKNWTMFKTKAKNSSKKL